MKLCNVSNGRRSLKAVLISLLIIFICASAFCGCVSAAEVTVDNINDLKEYLSSTASENNSIIIKLGNEITGDGSYNWVKGNNKTLDLNGNKYTTACDFEFLVYPSTTLTIMDSSTTGNGVIYSDHTNILHVYYNATLNLEKCKIDATNVKNTDTAISMDGTNKSAAAYKSVLNIGNDAVIICNGTCTTINYKEDGSAYGAKVNVYGNLKSINNVAISINGKVNKTTGNVPLITIGETAKLDGGVYVAGYCKWTFEPGCQVTGDEALSIKSGKFTINGGTFTGNGEYVNPPEAWSNGIYTSGAAIQVQSNDDYAGNVELNINGGNFISQKGIALLSTLPVPTKGDNKGKVPKNVFKEITINPSAKFESAAGMKEVDIRVCVDSFNNLTTAFESGYNVSLEKDINTMKVDDSFTIPVNNLNISLQGHKITTFNGGVLQGWGTTVRKPNADNGIEDVLSAGTYYPVFQFNITNMSQAGDECYVIIPEDKKDATVGNVIQLSQVNNTTYHFVKYNVTKYGTNEQVDVTLDGTFVMPDSDVNVSAEFSSDITEFNITVKDVQGGTITVTPVYALSGTIITITAKETDGYTFNSFTVKNESYDPENVIMDGNIGKFIMPNYNVTVTAAFTKNEVPVTPTPTSDDNYYYDDDDDDSSSSSTTTTPTVNPTQKPTVTPIPTVKPTPEPKTVVIVETEVKFEDNKVITSITVPEGSSGSITFTQTEEKGMDEWIPESIEDTYSFDLSCDGEINGDSEIHFVMSDVILKSLGLTPDDVCLKHFENGVWVKLKISYIVLDDGTYYFTAITKSFSPFKISFDGKSEEPTVTPTEEQPTQPQSPMPVLGLLMGLGAAALVLRRN